MQSGLCVRAPRADPAGGECGRSCPRRPLLSPGTRTEGPQRAPGAVPPLLHPRRAGSILPRGGCGMPGLGAGGVGVRCLVLAGTPGVRGDAGSFPPCRAQLCFTEPGLVQPSGGCWGRGSGGEG